MRVLVVDESAERATLLRDGLRQASVWLENLEGGLD
jgi:hypothetical protein